MWIAYVPYYSIGIQISSYTISAQSKISDIRLTRCQKLAHFKISHTYCCLAMRAKYQYEVLTAFFLISPVSNFIVSRL